MNGNSGSITAARAEASLIGQKQSFDRAPKTIRLAGSHPHVPVRVTARDGAVHLIVIALLERALSVDTWSALT